MRKTEHLKTLTINGNYTGAYGILILNTELHDDNSGDRTSYC
ncbi:autotransporter outer membrane beta-barrel domain-containing protein [Citrobacter koseri]|nr:autotransporter outer membrane beta-barrel domain-containing protein [Citrobacter sp. wls615]